MSRQYQERIVNSLSYHNLLNAASTNDTISDKECERLAQFKKIYAEYLSANDYCNAEGYRLRHSNFESEEERSQLSKKCQRLCKEVDKLDRQVRDLINGDLKPMAERLYQEAKKKRDENNRILVQEMREKERQERYERYSSEFPGKIRKPRTVPTNVPKLEDEIKKTKQQLAEIENELSRLKFCWFGEKYRYKKELMSQEKDLHDKLLDLFRR